MPEDEVAAEHNRRRDQDALRRAREAVAAEQARRATEFVGFDADDELDDERAERARTREADERSEYEVITDDNRAFDRQDALDREARAAEALANDLEAQGVDLATVQLVELPPLPADWETTTDAETQAQVAFLTGAEALRDQHPAQVAIDEDHQAHLSEAVRRQREALAATEALGRAVHLTLTNPRDFPTNESLADEAEAQHLDEQAKLKAISTPQPLPTFVDEILCAEQLLAAAGDTRNDTARANAFQAAQVHATLAVAKAIAELGLEL